MGTRTAIFVLCLQRLPLSGRSCVSYLKCFFARLSAMPFEVVLVNFVVRPSASQVLLSCAGHHLAHNTLILNDFTFINYF